MIPTHSSEAAAAEEYPQDSETPQVPDWVTSDIWGSIDATKTAATARTMLLAKGPYVTTPPLTVSGQQFAATPEKPARLIFRAYGLVTWAGAEKPMHTVQQADGSTTTVEAPTMGRVNFSFSPDEQRRMKSNGVMDLDLSSKLWVMLSAAYTKTYGTAPKTKADLKSYLEQYPVKVTLGIMGDVDPRNTVFTIAPVV